jgi:DNA-3-methyladenine glycosylase
MVLSSNFFTQSDPVKVAKQLIGKVLYTRINNEISSGIITETEAYAGIDDKASHAYGNKRTKRTEIMYQNGGYAYIYLIYGIYSLFNVVTNKVGVPHAVLIRSIFPFEGLEIMQQRNSGKHVSAKDGIGPGRLSRLLGINYKMTGIPLIKTQEQNAIWIEDNNIIIMESEIKIGKRIGVDYAEEDAELAYRFWIDSNRLDLVK